MCAADAGGGWFALLETRLRGAVEAALAAGADPDEPLRGLYISDDEARDLAARGTEIDAESRLSEVAERLALDDLDRAALAVCAAPELDPRCAKLYAFLQDDVTRRLASPRLVAELLAGEGVRRSDVMACFGRHAPLSAMGALRVLDGDAAAGVADRPVKVADRLAAFLLGVPGTLGESGVLRRIGVDAAAGREHLVAGVAELLAAPTRLPLLLCGPDAAAVLAAAARRPLVALDARELVHDEALRDAALAAALECAVLSIDRLDQLAPADRSHLERAIERHPRRLALIARRRSDALALGECTAVVVEVPQLTFAERRAAWTRFSGVEDPGEVAAKFRLSLAQIRIAAEVGVLAAHARGAAEADGGDLDLGARHASASQLGELATRLPPGPSWDRLILPQRPRDLLRAVSAHLRHRDLVLSEWGYETVVTRAQGLKVLFAGESGTGKTMAAQVLATELGLELFRVDLATVVSKYIGETEKNLDRIFGAADGSNAILFFDEADALFGKRSEVSDSHDRYANLEVSYLLQRMEEYPGAVVLATNFKHNIDDAFTRRLDFVIDFPFPEAEDRRRIWQLVLPERAPLAPDVDLDFLASQFKLSGGAIRNCSLAAAFQAAAAGQAIGMMHLVRAVAQEYSKQGRLTLKVEFERFHDLVRVVQADADVDGPAVAVTSGGD